MEYKKCRKCKKEKEINQFLKNKECVGGYTWKCKECQNTSLRKWRDKNSKRLLPILRKQYAERYGVIQKEKERQRKLVYPIRMRAQILRHGMKQRSENLKLVFDESIFTVSYLMDLLKSNPYCECCGKKLDIGFKLDKKPNDNSPSMDRKIPQKGYTKENTALLCWRCNNLKRDASIQELETISRWMQSFGNQINE